jgi:hypothetical protein
VRARSIQEITTARTNIFKTHVMAARIEITEPQDPAQQKKMIDAVQALDGVIKPK